jgi:2-phosphoglycerate kinase
MARALVVTGLDMERAYVIANRADRDLTERGAATLDLDRLAELAADVIGDEGAETTVRRLKRLHALQQLEVPLLLLIGGATGTGKSTLATEAAHRLGITRVTSTDFIRQTMRAFFSEEFMPSVHYSSFEARLALTRAEEEESGDAAILGFLDQTRNVLVGAQAALERAATERWSMVLEGVHLVPGMVTTAFPDDAFVVHCVVAIEDENLHRGHFWVREYSTEGLRPLEKYLDSLPQIRQIQDYLVERARRHDVPVIVNDSLDRAIGDVMDLVLRRADQVVATA